MESVVGAIAASIQPVLGPACCVPAAQISLMADFISKDLDKAAGKFKGEQSDTGTGSCHTCQNL